MFIGFSQILKTRQVTLIFDKEYYSVRQMYLLLNILHRSDVTKREDVEKSVMV